MLHALDRALERFPATVEAVAQDERAARLTALAADASVDWIVVLDGETVLQAGAFGAVRRAMGERVALIGGRALIGTTQRFGDMFGPSRSGPNPFELVPIVGLQSDRGIAEVVRGPIDSPHRGCYLVSAAFVREAGPAALHPITLQLDLAVAARARGFTVTCEPSMTYAAAEDPLDLRRELANLRRYADAAPWRTNEMHRDPERLRSNFVAREVRVSGNIRGYARQPYPPIDVLALVTDDLSRARLQRDAKALAVNGTVRDCDPGDGDALRRALGRTGDRYLLVAQAHALPSRAAIETLAERLERSSRNALAVSAGAAPFGATLFHCGRIANADMLAGATIDDVIASAVRDLPGRRLFAVAPQGRLVPDVMPPMAGLGAYDLVFVAASRPVVTEQSMRATLGETVSGTMNAVYPAGVDTLGRMLAVHTGLRVHADATDPYLTAALNRVLDESPADAIAIVRDDVQLPHGVLPRLADAFRRIANLGIAVPRVGGTGRPESLPDLGYRSSAEMQLLYDRRADAYAREATLLDVATAPVMMIGREALRVAGGFDPLFGFSRIGVEDFSRRVRAANFSVACCEDAYAHLFSATDAKSLLGSLDDAAYLREAFVKRWPGVRGFNPATDRVALTSAPAAPSAAAASDVVRVLIPLADAADFLTAKPFLAGLAATFRATDPIEVAIGIDGTYALSDVLAVVHEVLIASGVPMDDTINIGIDLIEDPDAWRDANPHRVRLAALERAFLAGVPAVRDAAGVRSHIGVPIA